MKLGKFNSFSLICIYIMRGLECIWMTNERYGASVFSASIRMF
jgi:hypothetical protein